MEVPTVSGIKKSHSTKRKIRLYQLEESHQQCASGLGHKANGTMHIWKVSLSEIFEYIWMDEKSRLELPAFKHCREPNRIGIYNSKAGLQKDLEICDFKDIQISIWTSYGVATAEFLFVFRCLDGKLLSFRGDLCHFQWFGVQKRTILLSFGTLLDESNWTSANYADTVIALLESMNKSIENVICLVGDNCATNRSLSNLLGLPLIGRP